MSHYCLAIVTALVILTSISRSAHGDPFGPGEAAARARATKQIDFKVVVWYRQSDPLGTFKFEIYDVRKGEYTAAVDDWINDVRARFPSYYVSLRAVDLAREKGATDLLKVGKVIDREVAVAAARAGIVIGSGRIDLPPVGYGIFGAGTAAASSRTRGPSRSRARAGLDRGYLKPSTSPLAVPAPILNRPR